MATREMTMAPPVDARSDRFRQAELAMWNRLRTPHPLLQIAGSLNRDGSPHRRVEVAVIGEGACGVEAE
jgi:hypothetical protein